MTRFCDVVGYGETVESPPESGVFVKTITERKRFGDVIRNTRRTQEDGTPRLNDEITVSNSISIVADAFDNEHIFDLKYVRWQNVRWKVVNVEVQRPRLILELGGKYNGPTPNGAAKAL